MISQTLTQVSDQDQRVKVCIVDTLHANFDFDIKTYDDHFGWVSYVPKVPCSKGPMFRVFFKRLGT